jgi:hypothetical protein
VDQPEVSLLTLVDRLARMEGLLVGLQNSIIQGQSQTSAFMARVERLEQRQVELETRQVTKEDLRDLSTKVDNLIKAEARHSGGVGVATWSISTVAGWAAVLIALLALVGVGMNRERIQQQTTPPQHRTP